MKVDGSFLVDARPHEMVEAAVDAERRGYDGWFSTDSSHDPFLPVAVAAGATARVQLGTAVAVAFARSPMTVAYTANDLQLLSEGRFILGLGSQVRAHITRRFSMPWGQPVERMREYVQALLAIWSAWNEEQPLRFEGEFYRFTLMTPGFTPPPNPFGRPRVYMAALGPRMAEVAGEVADGVILHPFTTRRHLTEVTWPALERGLQRSGREREAFEVVLPAFAVLADDDEQLEARAAETRARLAFYGSTPAYRSVLEGEGRGDLHEALHAATRRGEWDSLGTLLDRDMLGRFAPSGGPEEVGAELLRRYGGIVDRLSFYAPYEVDADSLDALRVVVQGG